MSLTLPRFTVRGTPEELGTAYGSEFRDLIRRFIPMRFEALLGHFAEAGAGDLDGVRRVGRESYPFFLRFDPEGAAEHEATARGAGVDPVDLFTAGNMTDLRDATILRGPAPSRRQGSGLPADAEGCSAVLIPGSHTDTGHQIVGQTWDLNPEDVEYIVALHRVPDTGPATWTVTVAGCPTLVGMNQHGLAVGTTNIKTWGSRPGVGYLNVLHKAVRCSSAEEAVAVVHGASRAGAHTYWLADGARAIELETSPDAVVVREATDAPVIRTNHCLAPAITRAEWQTPSSSSLTRLKRLQGLLAPPGQSVDGLRAALGSRQDGADSVSRHATDGEGTATNAVIIAVPAERGLYACRGPAELGDWVQLSFSDRVAASGG